MNNEYIKIIAELGELGEYIEDVRTGRFSHTKDLQVFNSGILDDKREQREDLERSIKEINDDKKKQIEDIKESVLEAVERVQDDFEEDASKYFYDYKLGYLD